MPALVCVFVWPCVSVYKIFLRHFFFSSSVPLSTVKARGNCGGRELVRAVSLGDVNVAMLSWHRT